jgi:hypothetical protein
MNDFLKLELTREGNIPDCPHTFLKYEEWQGIWTAECELCGAKFEDPTPPPPGSLGHRTVLVRKLIDLHEELKVHEIEDPLERIEAIEKIRNAEAPLDEWHPGWREMYPSLSPKVEDD